MTAMTTSMSVDLPGTGETSASDAQAFAADPAAYLRRMQDLHGDVFRTGPGQVHVGRPELVQLLLARTNRDASAEIDVLGDMRAPTRNQVDGWMRARRLAATAFRDTAVTAHLGVVDRTVRAQLRAAAGTPFDAMELAPEVFVHAALPFCVPGAEPGIAPTAAGAARTFLDVLENGMGAPPAEQQQRQEAARAAKQALRDATDAVTARESGTPPAPGCPHTVLRATQELQPAVRSHVLATVLSAASVVPGAALAWLFHELARRPGETARIREEARALPGDLDGCTLGDVLPYTQGFAKEVLRFHPPTWMTGRAIDQPLELGVHRLPGQQFVSFSPYLLHRDARWWDEPDRFLPERWLGPHAPHAPHAYLPFGSGTRVCIATHLGVAVLTLAAARVASDHVVELAGTHPVTPRFGVPLRPLNLRIVLRDPQSH
jgi:unspecific monooxygenase